MRCKACGVVRNGRDMRLSRTSCRACGTKYPVVVEESKPEPETGKATGKTTQAKPKKKATTKKAAKK